MKGSANIGRNAKSQRGARTHQRACGFFLNVCERREGRWRRKMASKRETVYAKRRVAVAAEWIEVAAPIDCNYVSFVNRD